MKISCRGALAFALLCGASLLRADDVNVNIYSGFQDTGGGAPFSGFVGSFTSPQIQFGTDTNFEWAPFGMTYFGADLTGMLDASATGIYRLAMTSDDGSELFVDGALAIDDGGTHAPGLAFADLSLTQGLHFFEIQYFQGVCCEAGLDLDLASGLTFAPAPEPGSQWLLGGGFFLSGISVLCLRRRNRDRSGRLEPPHIAQADGGHGK